MNKAYYPYYSILRIDHWIKNLFIIPGSIFAFIFFNFEFHNIDLLNFSLSFISICLISSANYSINEYLDRDTDKFHYDKKKRFSVLGKINPIILVALYFLLTLVSFLILFLIDSNKLTFIFAFLFLISGVFYNVKPIRMKDLPYLDVIIESINNPIRFTYGYSIMIDDISYLPISFILFFWLFGAFLMTVKRYSEYKNADFRKEIPSLIKYRKSFKYYSFRSLLNSIILYSSLSTFFLGIFTIKYKIEIILFLPVYIITLVFYFDSCYKKNNFTERPEKIIFDYGFMIILILAISLLIFIYLFDLNFLSFLYSPVKYSLN